MPFQTVITEEVGYPVVTLTDTETGCEAEIYAFGGLLNAFRVQRNQEAINVIEGFSSVQDATKNITNGFRSAKLSPFVCRMYKGHYTYGANEYTIQKYFLGEHAIHGILYDAGFQVIHTESGNEKASVTLEHQYPGTDKGYPFPYTIIINWKLETSLSGGQTGNKLTASTTISNQNEKSIPIADGWHPYFSLGGSVDEWTLQFDSEIQLEYNAGLLPTGKKFPDNRFINGTILKGIELDNSFTLSANHSHPKCVLQNDKLRLTIEPDSGYPVLQIYIPAHRKSVAIENLSGAPDNFNNGMGLILLPPGESKTFVTSYSITSL